MKSHKIKEMGKDVIGSLLLVLSFVVCSSVPEPQGIEDRDILNLCEPRDFTGYEIDMVGEVFPISEPLRIRNIRGRITHPDWQGSWSWGTCKPVLFLRSHKNPIKMYEIRCNATGRIVFKKLPPGIYCFFACSGCPGFDGAYGIIIIDKKADPNKEINIELPLAAP